ncbi:MAG: hypothetical protein WAT29_01810 [Thiolinea sp.]
MQMSFFTSKGEVVQVGHELGKGGEGSVYEMLSNSNQVVKLYNAQHMPDVQKQGKLSFMAASGDGQLLDYAAWPLEVVRRTQNGPIVGFLMPKVIGYEQVHMLYSPAHRRQNHPELAWDFLVHVSRNIAAAFATIHKYGHIISDVNQSNVLVRKDSKVMLIDCDSFQINANGVTHFCEVGVPEFTPPELQGQASFKGVKRTANHDNFGLALFIFHLLFGGRHPFAGKPLRRDVGEVLQNDIKAFRFAYGNENRLRGFEPPPNSIPFSLIPNTTQALFEAAFTERGASGSRPSAQQWLSELDSLRSRLRHCNTVKTHVYPNHLVSCPWCALENRGVIYFLDIGLSFTKNTSSFVLATVWAAIENIQPLQDIKTPTVGSSKIVSTPLPKSVNKGVIDAIGRIALILIIAVALFSIKMSGVGLLIIIVIWFIWRPRLKDERSIEYIKRKNILSEAQGDFSLLERHVQNETKPERFNLKKQELIRLRDEYESLALQEKNELEKLHKNAEFYQRQRFLERFFIESATISGVGSSKKAALRSFGIETAADVTRSKVQAVHGFGNVLTNAVVDWRKSCERRFVFNPQNAISESDKNVVRAKIGIRRRSIEASLIAGPADLQRLREEIAIKSKALYPQLEVATNKLKQAQADMTVFNN